MDDTITTIYCLCDEFLKAIRHKDDPQVRLTTAEVMTVPLVAATFFGGNLDKTRRFLHEEYGYMPKMISKGRFDHRLHAIEPTTLWRELFALLAEAFKRNNPGQTYVVDSLAVAVCDNIRIRRCRLYPPEEHAGAFRGYIPSKRRYFYGLCGCIWWSRGQASRWGSRWRRARKRTSRCSRAWIWTCRKAPSSWPTTITRISSKRSGCA